MSEENNPKLEELSQDAEQTENASNEAPAPAEQAAKLSLTIGAEFWDPQASVVQLNVLLARIEKMQFDPGTILEPYSFWYKLLEGDLSHEKIYIKEVEGFNDIGLNCEIERGVLRVSGAGDGGRPTNPFDGAVQIKLTAKLEFRLGADQLIQKVFNFNRPKSAPAYAFFNDLTLTPKPFYITPASETFYQGSLRRLPVYILVDTSKSMRGEPIEVVKIALQTFLSCLRCNPYALETVWLSIISYDVNAKVLTPLTELSEAAIPPLSVHQTFSTNLGGALTLLMKRVDREVRRTTSTSKGDWWPILIVMTDSEPSDTLFFERAISTVKAYPFARIVACCTGSRAKVGPLRLLTDDIYSLGTMNDVPFSRFWGIWDWVSCDTNDSMGGMNLSDGDSEHSELPPPPPEINLVPPPPPEINIVL